MARSSRMLRCVVCSRSRESICSAVDRRKVPLSLASSSDVFGDKLGPDDGETKSSTASSLSVAASLISLSTHDRAVSQFKVSCTLWILDWGFPRVSR